MTIPKEPYEGEHIIDSREVIEFVGWLDEDDEEEMADNGTIVAFNEEGEETFADWLHGVTLIADHYFVEYAREFADDIGAVDANADWPTAHIDWERAAEALQMDYTSIEFGSTTYWGR